MCVCVHLCSKTRAAAGRTTILIAHRLSTIRSADEIVVMNEGAVVERGAHDELLTMHGRYYDLWTMQNSPSVEDADTYVTPPQPQP